MNSQLRKRTYVHRATPEDQVNFIPHVADVKAIAVITPAWKRVETAEYFWPKVRDSAGVPIHWIIVIDGDLDNPEHRVSEMVDTAKKYADEVVVAGSWVGVGAAMEKGRLVSLGGPIFKLDMDVLPSQNWAFEIMLNAQQWDDSNLGMISGLPKPTYPRNDIGPRKSWLVCTRISYYTERGLLAIGDMTTPSKWGENARMVNRRLHLSKLWAAYTHSAWITEHDDEGSMGKGK